MVSKSFSKRMLQSKKRTGSGTGSARYRYRPTPWKLFIDAVTRPRDTVLGLFGKTLFVYGIVLIVLIVGGTALAQGPLFHSSIHMNKPCEIFQNRPNVITCDAVTYLYRNIDPSGSLSGFNTFAPATVGACGTSNSGCVSYLNSAQCGGTSCIEMAGNQTHTALAEVSTPIPAIDLANGKTIGFSFDYQFNGGGPRQFSHWGYYLTTNNTLPTVANYDPRTDKAVFYLHLLEIENPTQLNGPYSVFAGDFILRSLGKGDTMNSEDAACGLGPRFMCITHNNGQGVWVDSIQYFNTTGTNGANPGCVPIVGQNPGNGPGCSWDKNGDLTDTSTGVWGSNNIHPQFPASNQYYLVFFVGPNMYTTAQINMLWSFEQGTHGHNVSTFNNIAVTPTIDTGGFFGPIIRALISIGVFIVQNVINFFAFLASILWPVLSNVFSILANALVLVLNSIGNFFGLGNIGTSISNFFAAVGNFLVNGVGAIVGQILNAGNFFVNGVTAFVNLVSTYFNYITSFLTAVSNFLGILGTVITALLTLGAFSGNLALFMDWTWGMYKVYDEGTEGFHRWLDFNEKIFLRAGTITYFIADHIFTVILRVKQIIVQWV